MTCFWDAILTGLKHLKLEPIVDNNYQLIELLQTHNQITYNVMGLNQYLPPLRLIENFDAIRNLDKNQIHSGHLCSAVDYVLMLVAQLYRITIIHNFNGTEIIYKPEVSVAELRLSSSRIHCSFVRASRLTLP